MIKAIIIDLDGTSLPSNHTRLSEENLKALGEAGKKNIMRILATGRSYFSITQTVEHDLPIDYLVFSSGAGIMRWSDKQILLKRSLNKEQTKEIAHFLWSFNVNFTIQKPIPNNHHFLYTNLLPTNEDFARRISRYSHNGTLINKNFNDYQECSQFLMILNPEQVNIHNEIKEKLTDFSVIRATSPFDNAAIWTEIFPKDIHKGTTCQILLEKLNLDFNECAGLGNDYNDIDFLKLCRHPYLVDNAPDELKKLFPTVGSDINNGLAEFIQTVI